MTRVVMEHVEYELNVPETGVQPDSLTFVEIDQEKCIGCDTCQQYCLYWSHLRGKLSSRIPSNTEILYQLRAVPDPLSFDGDIRGSIMGPQTGKKAQGQPREMRGHASSVRTLCARRSLWPACRNCDYWEDAVRPQGIGLLSLLGHGIRGRRHHMGRGV